MLAAVDHESKQSILYYINQEDDRFNIQVIKSHSSGEAITALCIQNTDESPDQRMFEIVYGTKMGSLFHGKLYLDGRGGQVVNETPIEEVLICSNEPVCDIKIVRTESKLGVLAVTAGSFHQFWGNKVKSIKEIL